MATYNIQMEYFNGSSYDNLFPWTSVNNLEGVLPIEHGGTGASSESNALGNLINNSSVAENLTNTDYLGAFNNNSGRKVTLSSLNNYLTNNLSGLKAYHLTSTMQVTGTGSATSDYAHFSFIYSGNYTLAIALSFVYENTGGSYSSKWSFVWFMTKNSDYGIYYGGEYQGVEDGTFNSTRIYGRISARNYSRVYRDKQVDLFLF